MKQYLADLHIHTCLSPCGSLEMSPSEIVRRSLAKGLDAIAITDHNTTLQCPEIQSLGERFGLRVFAGEVLATHDETQRQALYRDILTRLHDEAVYLPISYISMMVVSKPELGNIPYAPIATEIPFEQIKPVKP